MPPFHCAWTNVGIVSVKNRVCLHVFYDTNSKSVFEIFSQLSLMFGCKNFGKVFEILSPSGNFFLVDVNPFRFTHWFFGTVQYGFEIEFWLWLGIWLWGAVGKIESALIDGFVILSTNSKYGSKEWFFINIIGKPFFVIISIIWWFIRRMIGHLVFGIITFDWWRMSMVLAFWCLHQFWKWLVFYWLIGLK